mmetsp:Transcript_3961/g.13214  ORF Transcript_3961/g.13214 Transcript_3961/m.13214 type:complete len:93 (-) Transcript_3961:117-395(-)
MGGQIFVRHRVLQPQIDATESLGAFEARLEARCQRPQHRRVPQSLTNRDAYARIGQKKKKCKPVVLSQSLAVLEDRISTKISEEVVKLFLDH